VSRHVLTQASEFIEAEHFPVVTEYTLDSALFDLLTLNMSHMFALE